MSNPFINWLQSRKFSTALHQGNIQLAQKLLEKKQRAGAKLSLLEKVFRDKIQFEQSANHYEREVLVLRAQTSQNSQIIEQLTRKNQQLEQSVESVLNQLKHKEQEVSSIQQQLASRRKEIGVQNKLKHKEQEVISIQQQLEARKQESDLLQKQLVSSSQEIEGLRNELKLKEREFYSIRHQLEIRGQEKQALLNQLNQTSKSLTDNFLVAQVNEFNDSVKNKFKFNEINDRLLQCTGIDKEIFYELEENLVKYLSEEFKNYTPQINLKQHLIETYNKDIATSLKKGRDPEYSSYLTPHIYFMKYFL